ncbi:MAG: FtsX-like permease family protein [Chloroflexi bacterium]|nr:FtsX-like permease family protein [Chloroflexota bacterium]
MKEPRGPSALWEIAGLAYHVARRRATVDWRLQLAVAFGMLLAVALMTSGVIYSIMLRESALQYTLRQTPPQEVDLAVRVFNPLDPAIFANSSRFVEERVFKKLRPYLRDRSLYIRTSTFFFAGRPEWETSDSVRPRGPLQYMSGLEEHIRVVEGRLPRAAGARLEAVLDPQGAAALGIGVGDVVELFPAVIGKREESVPVQVVGLIEPRDPGEEFWFGEADRFTHTFSEWTTVPMFATEEGLFTVVAQANRGLYTDFMWFFYLDRENLRAKDVAPLRASVESIIQDVHRSLPNSSETTGLDRVLTRYDHRLLLARIPLFLLVFLVVGALMYYLFLVAGLLGRLRGTEVTLLKGRGATTAWIEVLALVEGLLLAIPAVVLGPFLALAVVLVADRLAPSDLGRVGLLSAAMSPQAFLLGAVGGLLAVAVFTLSILGAARRSVVEQRQMLARPPRAPLLHRYYLDLLVLALMGLVWWQLRERGSVLVRPLGTEGLRLDFSLLLGPVLGLAGVGLLVLRFFPLVLGALARAVEPLGIVWLAQGLKPLARNPIPAGSLLVLLMLATALGVVGAAFGSTLERSLREQALYSTGSDVRVEYVGRADDVMAGAPATSLANVPGVAHSVNVVRANGSVTTKTFGKDVTVLAVDSGRFAQGAWFRPDFGPRPLDELMAPLGAAPAPSGIPLPGDAQALSIWVQPGRPFPDSRLIARFQDARGFYFDVAVGDLDFRGWRLLEAPVRPLPPVVRRPGEPAPSFASPFTLQTLYLALRRTDREPGALFLDEMSVASPSLGKVMLADFQELGGWRVLEDYSAPGHMALEQSRGVARPGRVSAAFTWSAGGLGLLGIRAGPPETPLPALVSPAFLKENNTSPGQTVVVWASGGFVPLKVAGVVDYFPTLNPDREMYTVVDLGGLAAFLGLRTPRGGETSGEIWVRAGGPILDGDAVRKALESRGLRVYRVHDVAALMSSRLADPLVTAGWGGLLALSFLTVVLASVSGLMLYASIDARERQTEFALLRTLGFSKGQLSGVIWLSLLLVAACGIGLGTWVGHYLGRALLPMLEVAEGGGRLVPPMILQVDWAALGIAYLVLAVATAGTVLGLARMIARLEVQRVLRMGEA